MTGPPSSTSVLDSKSPDAPTGGIENGGWKVTYNDQPIHLPGRRGNAGDAYSIGLQLGEDGSVGDSIVGGPAYSAGISSGMKVIGVNGRVYTHDLLEDAIAAAKGSTQPITLTYVNDDYIRTATIDYHQGARYPHLTRDDSKPTTSTTSSKRAPLRSSELSRPRSRF